jgi:hypothetical protein
MASGASSGPTGARLQTTANAQDSYMSGIWPLTSNARYVPTIAQLLTTLYTKLGISGGMYQASGDTNVASFDWFVGWSDSTTPFGGSANAIGVGKQSADTNWQIILNKAGTITKSDTGVAWSKGVQNFYRLTFDGTTVVAQINGNATTSYSTTANIPSIGDSAFVPYVYQIGRAATTRSTYSFIHVDRWE